MSLETKRDRLFEALIQSAHKLITYTKDNKVLSEQKHTEEETSGCMQIFFLGGLATCIGYFPILNEPFISLIRTTQGYEWYAMLEDYAIVFAMTLGCIAASIAIIIVLKRKLVSVIVNHNENTNKKINEYIDEITSYAKKLKKSFVDRNEFQSFLIRHQARCRKEDQNFLSISFAMQELFGLNVARAFYESYSSILKCTEDSHKLDATNTTTKHIDSNEVLNFEI